MECPICSKVFPASEINLHVNNCLNIHEDVGVTAHTSAPAADEHSPQTALGNDSSRNIKRKTASWGSLQPMHLTTAPPQVKRYKNQQMRNAWLIDNQQKQKVEGISAPVEEVKSIQKLSTPCSATYATTTRVEANKENLIKKRMTFEPLAECMRPQNLTDYVGQEQVLGKNSMLYSLLQSDAVPSMILWGPPGCGKTSLAHIIAKNCRSRGMAKFVSLSAATCGVNEVKDTIRTAHTEQKLLKKKTILFLDEIHRFNKTQQDVLLPHVENGTITLIGATTENPSFQVNSALLSRCRVVVLEKLATHHILIILHKALLYVGGILITTPAESPPLPVSENLHQVYVEQKALEMLANLVDGDARAALNGLQMAVQAKTQIYLQTSEVPCVSFKSDGDNSQKSDSTQEKHIISSQSLLVTVDDIKEGLQRSHVLYDKTGEEHYNIISALHKSMRGSDASASLYWLARMLEGGENPLYIARRLIRFASEDVGLVDPQALPQAVAAYQACHLIGMPECDVILAQCAVYLARAPKSVEIYRAYGKAKACVRDHRGPLPPVPLHLRNAPTQLMKSLGNAKDYKYNPDYDEPVDQNYFPKELSGADFFN